MDHATANLKAKGRIIVLSAAIMVALVGAAVWFGRIEPGRPDSPSTPPAAALVQAPATEAEPWRREDVFQVDHFGRFAVRAVSPTGTMLQLIDRMAGPGPEDGIAGKQDGRIDTFLGPGDHKAILTGPPASEAPVQLIVAPFEELNSGTPPRLEELGSVSTELGDFQQRSYWLDVPTRRTVFIEAAGRHLGDLRLWRDGSWLVDALPVAEQVEPKPGQPLALYRLVTDLEPGLYRLTAYGGAGVVWAEGAAEKPLHLRAGIPTLPAAMKRQFTAGPFGMERWLVPRSANYFRLEIPESGTASLDVAPWSGAQPVTGERVTIDKDNRSRAVDRNLGGSMANGQYLVTVERPAGERYTLQHHNAARVQTFAGSGLHLITPVDPGAGEDDIDLTAVLSQLGTPEKVVFSSALKVSRTTALKRRFNVVDTLTLFVEIGEAGRYAVETEGVETEISIAPLITSPGAKPSAPKLGSATWDLDAGLQVLTISPRPENLGIVTLTIRGEGAAAPTELSARHNGALPPVSLDTKNRYTLTLNRTGGRGLGAAIRRLPLDPEESAALIALPPGGEIKLPVTVGNAGRLELTAEDGTRLTSEGADRPLYPTDETTVPIVNPFPRPLLATLSFRPDQAPSQRPLPPLSAERLAMLPQFPPLAPGGKAFLDLGRRATATYAVTVAQPALYRVETTGLLATSVNLRTQVIPSLVRGTANGTGRNALIQRYLRPGAYQLTVGTEGQTTGHLGVELTAAPVRDGGGLTAGLAARSTLGAGEGVAYGFDVPSRGPWHLEALALAGETALRLEDSDGWPLTTPDQGGLLETELRAGHYRLVVLPQALPARIVTLARPVVAPVEFSGHGPHPLALDGRVANRWEESAERQPDLWTFDLPAAATLTFALSDGMEADLQTAGGEAVASFSDRQPLVRRLEKGSYRLAARTVRPNNRFDYTLDAAATELTVGRRRAVTAPAEIPISIGEERLVEIASAGVKDVRATLLDGSGRMVAHNDDRPDDWNFAIAARLKPGIYTLRVEPVGAATAATTVELSQRPEVTDPPLAAAMEIADAAVHTVPLNLSGTGTLVVAAARSALPVGLRLERRQGEDNWQAVGAATGRQAVLAIPRDPAVARFYRLQVWSLDQTATPITVTAAAVSPATASEKALSGGLTLSPLPGLPAAAAMVELDRPGLFQGAPDTFAWASQPDRRALASGGPVIIAGSDRLWLLGEAGETVTLRRVIPDAKAPLTLTLGEGDSAALPLGDERGPQLWLAEARIGQPGLAIGSDARSSGLSAGASIAVMPEGRPAKDSVLRLWRADESSGDLPLLLRRFTFAAVESGQWAWGVNDGGLKSGGALKLALPSGAKRLRLALPAGTAAVLLDKDTILGTLWSGDQPAAETVETSADHLLVLNTTADAVRLSGLMVPAQDGQGLAVISRGTLLSQWQPEAGTLRFELAKADNPLTVTLAGAVTDGLLLQKDGVVRQGRVLSVTDEATLLVRSRPGLVAVWLDGADDKAWPSTGPAIPALTGTVPLTGAEMGWSIEQTVPALLHVEAAVPVVTGLRRPGQPPEVAVWPQGAGLNVMLAKGITVLGLRSLSGSLGGGARLGRSEPVEIREGLGSPVRLAGGEARLFAFTVGQPGPIGVGVKGSADTASLGLYDESGARLATGTVAMRTMSPGRYFLLVENRPDAAPVEVRPALVGVDRPPPGPPEEVRRRYWQMVSDEGDK